ncbi:MAG: glycosyltransferase [Candidatus Marinimicrobia bacterium]|jgi:glycosyltransferase involved in cell wall biosynthesis|nr:glycosyltransferase [Candidatus Neomarinimicrobiota bacterium]MBT3500909.1 glycosyltransferase [Candidatus Neomarinimicrobiota bacterium]MBT3840096.1 glycosyltransferase [Candidatus Neomarinimicrobiota bacterium]MBT3999935.1 glycosyltransferase [Candidatus Neomarinimicrobiota bacterium]MBT4282985.1 glycosyltransferase [Candidatus Neomarinimicrobiota bacterium]
MTGYSPIISIVTPSYNRADELIHLYRSLQNQSFDLSLIEFIISDDGSTDSTAKIVKTWQSESAFPIKFITQENQGPGAARNHGLENSIGDLILFIDSDCEAHPEWIKIIYDEYKKDSFDACGGPDAAKDDFTTLQKAIDFAMTSFFTTGGMRGHSEKMMAKFFPRTHNMGIKRSVYEQVGGFGSLRHGQDIEFSNRIRKSGARIRFMLDAVVYHRRRTSLKQFFKQVFNWGVARVNLGKIDSSMLEPIHTLPSLAVLISMSIIGVSLYANVPTQALILFFFVPLGLLSLFGAYKKNDLKIFPYLFIVIPAQIIGYGIGFIFNFIKRYIFHQKTWTGFRKKYYD